MKAVFTNRTRWTSPILGQEAQTLYEEAYGASGEQFLKVLETSPYEIAVISRMIACLQRRKEAQ